VGKTVSFLSYRPGAKGTHGLCSGTKKRSCSTSPRRQEDDHYLQKASLSRNGGTPSMGRSQRGSLPQKNPNDTMHADLRLCASRAQAWGRACPARGIIGKGTEKGFHAHSAQRKTSCQRKGVAEGKAARYLHELSQKASPSKRGREPLKTPIGRRIQQLPTRGRCRGGHLPFSIIRGLASTLDDPQQKRKESIKILRRKDYLPKNRKGYHR